MTDREKAPYYEMAEEDKERYETEMLDWRPGQMYQVDNVVLSGFDVSGQNSCLLE